MRVALHSTLNPGHEAAYVADHADIPEELAASFARFGIRDWSIWRSGDQLFHLVECDDFGEAMRRLESDPANLRWQEFIGVHVKGFLPGGAPAPLDQVWRLAAEG